MTSNRDPHDIHRRVEDQIHLILLEMEENPERFALKDRLSMVQIVGMYLTRNLKLVSDESISTAGTAVRKYAGAFKTNVARGRADRTRSSPALVVTSDPDPDDPDAA